MLNKNYRVIEEFSDYMITEDGEVWSDKSKVYKVSKGLRKLTPTKDRRGYEYVDLVEGRLRRKRFYIHRLVCYYFCEGYFENAVVNHIDANINNNHYSNLEWVTQAENIHKSYVTSGMNQTRNFRYYIIQYPDGYLTEPIKTGTGIEKFIKINNLPIKRHMIVRDGLHKGYGLLRFDKDLKT